MPGRAGPPAPGKGGPAEPSEETALATRGHESQQEPDLQWQPPERGIQLSRKLFALLPAPFCYFQCQESWTQNN